jgi:peptidoglycan hydrolase-like protein with peptidoglycan-binding domain
MRTLMISLVVAMAAVAAPASAAPADTDSPPAAERAQATCHRTLPTYPAIEPGTTSEVVRTLQCVLNDAGWGPITVDGFYGPETKRAVRTFTDGFECCIASPLRVRTWYWTILFSQSRRLRGLELGDSGIRVKTLQRALRADGETLVVDGDFGTQTRARVKVFQGKCGLTRSGRVNGKTAFFLGQGGCNG